MKELIEYIAKSLVDDPSQVTVSEVEGTNSLIIELHVASEDMGRVIAGAGVWRMPCAHWSGSSRPSRANGSHSKLCDALPQDG